MSEETHFAAGTALAAMQLHLAIFRALLGGGLVTPQYVREMLDSVMLACEGQQGSNIPELGHVASHAQQQVQALLKNLEELSPEMRANPPSA